MTQNPPKIVLVNPIDYPTWHGVDAATLESNSNAENSNTIFEQPRGSKTLQTNGGIVQVLSGGRSGAQVFVTPDGRTVLKADTNHEKNALEARLYNALRERGIPVPASQAIDEIYGIATQNLGPRPFNVDFYENARNEMHEGSFGKIGSRIDTYGNQVPTLLSSVSVALENIFTDTALFSQDEIASLQASPVARVARDVGIDEQTTATNYYTLRILRAIPGASQDVVAHIKPLADLITKATQEFGAWSANVNPRNLFFTIDKDDTPVMVCYDFNHVEWMPMQLADTYMIDAYLPARGDFANPYMLDPQGKIATSPLSEDQKMQMVGERVQKFEELTRNTIEDRQYNKYLYVCRFLGNLQEAHRALKELHKADTYQELVDRAAAVDHHKTLAIQSLAVVAKQEGIDANPLAEKILEGYSASLQTIPRELYTKAAQWFSS